MRASTVVDSALLAVPMSFNMLQCLHPARVVTGTQHSAAQHRQRRRQRALPAEHAHSRCAGPAAPSHRRRAPLASAKHIVGNCALGVPYATYDGASALLPPAASQPASHSKCSRSTSQDSSASRGPSTHAPVAAHAAWQSLPRSDTCSETPSGSAGSGAVCRVPRPVTLCTTFLQLITSDSETEPWKSRHGCAAARAHLRSAGVGEAEVAVVDVAVLVRRAPLVGSALAAAELELCRPAARVVRAVNAELLLQ